MKYIKKFNSETQLETYKKSNFVSPHVYLNANLNTVKYMEEYQQLQYISSTSTGGQYIDLGCHLMENTDDIQIDIKFNIKGHGKTGIDQSTLIAAQPEVNPYPGFTMRILNYDVTDTRTVVTFNTKWLCSEYWGTYVDANNKKRYGCIYLSPKTLTGNAAVITGGSFTNLNNVYEYSILLDNIPQDQCHNMNTHLFCALNSSGQPFRFIEADLHYLKFTKGGQVIRNLIPVKKVSTNEIGLYDMENDHLYISQGDEPFVAGPIINN